jgi:ribonuclease HI
LIEIYIDGSGTTATTPAGIGLVTFKEGKIIGCESLYIGLGTNNFAELFAMKRALQKARAFNAYQKKVKVYSDSQYAIGSCKKVYRTNELLSAQVRTLFAECARWTKVLKVEGHSGNLGNDIADWAAGRARESCMSLHRPPISFALRQLECFSEKLAERIKDFCPKEYDQDA